MANQTDIETAIALAEAQTGVRGGNRNIPLCFESRTKRGRIWTQEENNFIYENHGRLSESEIAERLGRTSMSVHIHKERELKLRGMSKDPGVITAEQVANGLGCDSKTIHLLMDTGRMPGRRLPAARTMRVIDKLALMQWMINPDHWLYFKINRVGMLYRRGTRGPGEIYDFAFWDNAHHVMAKAKRKWKDQWLTPGQVTRQLRIKAAGTRYVNKAIRNGNLKAIRWGNWWIRKTDLPAKGKTINFKGEIVARKLG